MQMTVIDDDWRASKLLSANSRQQYPILRGPHRNYLLEGRAKGRNRFCSPLLSNTVFAAACHRWTAIPEFIAEAKRQWDLRDGKSSLTAIQETIICKTIMDLGGLDTAGQLYVLQVIAMAHDLRLFDASLKVESTKMRRS